MTYAQVLVEKSELERLPDERDRWLGRLQRSDDLRERLELQLLKQPGCEHGSGRSTVCMECVPKVPAPAKLAEDVMKLAQECGLLEVVKRPKANTAAQALLDRLSQEVIFPALQPGWGQAAEDDSL